MNENKHGSRELPPANLKSQIWADGESENVNRNRSLSFAVKGPNLDLKVSCISFLQRFPVFLFH